MQSDGRILRRFAAIPFFFVLIAVFSASTPAALLASLTALASLALLMIWLAKKPSPSPSAPGSSVHFPLTAEMELASALAAEDGSRCRTILHQIIIQKNPDADLCELSRVLEACGARIQNTLQKPSAHPFAEGANLCASESPEELLEAAIPLFEALAAALKQQRGHPALSEKMLAFIDGNFHKNIALTDLAEHLNLTPNYVSTLFRNEIGSNFKEYLGKRRFLHAASLLESNRRIKIKDAAKQSGCSVDILGRLFLRYSGVSPQEYKRRHAAGAPTDAG